MNIGMNKMLKKIRFYRILYFASICFFIKYGRILNFIITLISPSMQKNVIRLYDCMRQPYNSKLSLEALHARNKYTIIVTSLL
jgi:hypothetical protein